MTLLHMFTVIITGSMVGLILGFLVFALIARIERAMTGMPPSRRRH